ncbi:MAG TPA: L,D-transpeptidase family protein [Novosphingobium sp.]|nr:L,D-transpeptidase family protein [Novosphingobium sp.]
MSLAMAGPLAWLCAAPASAGTPAVTGPTALNNEIADRLDGDLRPFYAARGYRPVWIGSDRKLDPAAAILLRKIEGARFDAIKEGKLKARSLRKVLGRATAGTPDDLAQAEVQLSETLATYVRLMRTAPHAAMLYESKALAPAVPTPAVVLDAATARSGLAVYIETMAWMHPFYAPMRDALHDRRLSERQRSLVLRNLERIRALPATPADRYVLVDAASARLWMYEQGQPVDTMRVVVGKPRTETPMMAGFLRYAIANPYWNVPGDLVQATIANNVLDKGRGYLKKGGYQVLSDWSERPRVVDPKAVDWAAVAAGATQVRVRQLPGGPNFMGKVKFEFPNAQGIYLHDTPDKQLLREDARQLSNGCVRLEDASRFGRWLLRKPLPRRLKNPEQRIDLPQLVPIYITYLTAMPENGKIAFRDDVYGRDAGGKLARSD